MIVSTRKRKAGIEVTISDISIDRDGVVVAYEAGSSAASTKVTYETTYLSARNAVLAVFVDLFPLGLNYTKSTAHAVKRVTAISKQIAELERQLAELKRKAENC